MESTVDFQFENYKKLCIQHHTIRREHQGILLEPSQNLRSHVMCSLANDKRIYKGAKEGFYYKFNIFKRLFTHSASTYKTSSVEPFKEIYLQRKYLSTQVNQLLDEIKHEMNPIEIRRNWNGSVAVVYNPITGHTEWKQYRHGGIHGVFNPITRSVEWEYGSKTGIYGVFNPQLNIVEWKKLYKGGVHGVYNPSIGAIEWQTSFCSGIGGVYNPLTQQTEWRTSFHGGVVGYFDNEKETIKWIEKWHHGIALVSWDTITNTYLTTASCGWYGDD